MSALAAYEHLPGGRRFVTAVARDLAAGRSTLIVLPAGVPPDEVWGMIRRALRAREMSVVDHEVAPDDGWPVDLGKWNAAGFGGGMIAANDGLGGGGDVLETQTRRGTQRLGPQSAPAQSGVGGSGPDGQESLVDIEDDGFGGFGV